MIRLCRLVLWYVVGLLLGGVSVSAFAQSSGTYYTLNNTTTPKYSGATAPCTASGYVGAGTFAQALPPGASYWCFKYVNSVLQVGPDWVKKTVVSCASDQYLDPSTYQCTSGTRTCAEVHVTAVGSCVKSVPCGEASSVPLSSALLNQPICADQKPEGDCASNGGIVIGMMGDKPICLSPPPSDPTCEALGGVVNGTINGQPICSLANNPTCPDGSPSVGTVNGQPVCNGTCGAGMAPGTVNGVTSCYPIGKTTDKKTDQKGRDQSKTETDSNGKNQTTNKSTTCEGERCTTKETTTDNATGVTVTKETVQEKSDFCTQNPKSTVCTGQSDQDQFCKDNPKAVSCMEAGAPGEEGALSSVEKGISSITPVTLASSSGCPADIQLPKGATITYQGVCMYAEGMRPFVLISAWLLAGLIVLGMAPRG